MDEWDWHNGDSERDECLWGAWNNGTSGAMNVRTRGWNNRIIGAMNVRAMVEHWDNWSIELSCNGGTTG
jgi:hypothetical protein